MPRSVFLEAPLSHATPVSVVPGRGRKWTNEADLPAECAQTGQDPRFSEADVNQGRARSHPVASGEGTPPPLGVKKRTTPGAVGPVRSRKTFEDVRRRGVRGRSGPVQVSFVRQPSWSGLEFAYAVHRSTGSAVARNRLKRRLRAIVFETATTLPTGAYLVRAGSAGAGLGFEELRVAMNEALQRASKPGTSEPTDATTQGAIR